MSIVNFTEKLLYRSLKNGINVTMQAFQHIHVHMCKKKKNNNLAQQFK